jgi:hypothetical protein
MGSEQRAIEERELVPPFALTHLPHKQQAGKQLHGVGDLMTALRVSSIAILYLHKREAVLKICNGQSKFLKKSFQYHC